MNPSSADYHVRGLYQYLKATGHGVERYGNASHAFKDVLLHLNGKARLQYPNVVMPAFIPAKLYRTVIAAGYEPKFYDIDDRCRFDPQEVEDLVDERTTSIFAVHYFGHPADVVSLCDISYRKNIFLIEDCAHVLQSMHCGKPLGTFGDFSIFSVRKMLQLSDGGLLLLNREFPDFKPTFDKRVRSIYTTSKYFSSRLKHIYMKMTGGRDPFHLTRPANVGRLEPGRLLELKVKRTSYVTALYGKTADIQRNSASRRDNYERLYNSLKGFGFLKPVYDELTATWTPYSLPFIMSNGQRTALQGELLKFGINCGLGWPESPFGERLDKTRNLARRLIEFPVHPLMIEKQFGRIIDACESFARKYGGG